MKKIKFLSGLLLLTLRIFAHDAFNLTAYTPIRPSIEHHARELLDSNHLSVADITLLQNLLQHAFLLSYAKYMLHVHSRTCVSLSFAMQKEIVKDEPDISTAVELQEAANSLAHYNALHRHLHDEWTTLLIQLDSPQHTACASIFEHIALTMIMILEQELEHDTMSSKLQALHASIMHAKSRCSALVNLLNQSMQTVTAQHDTSILLNELSIINPHVLNVIEESHQVLEHAQQTHMLNDQLLACSIACGFYYYCAFSTYAHNNNPDLLAGIMYVHTLPEDMQRFLQDLCTECH